MKLKPGMIVLEVVSSGNVFVMELVSLNSGSKSLWQVLYWNPDMENYKGFYRYEEDQLPVGYYSTYGKKELAGKRVFVLWEDR
jgi:hypothetical protein